MDLDEANKLWFEFQPIEGVKFGLNDTVRIVSEKYLGEYASVISLVSLEPTTYLIELASGGGDLTILESELEMEEKYIWVNKNE